MIDVAASRSMSCRRPAAYLHPKTALSNATCRDSMNRSVKKQMRTYDSQTRTTVPERLCTSSGVFSERADKVLALNLIGVNSLSCPIVSFVLGSELRHKSILGLQSFIWQIGFGISSFSGETLVLHIRCGLHHRTLLGNWANKSLFIMLNGEGVYSRY